MTIDLTKNELWVIEEVLELAENEIGGAGGWDGMSVNLPIELIPNLIKKILNAKNAKISE